MVEQRFRWDFIGLSTDTKPTPADSPKVVDGSTYYCSDTSKLYVFCKDTWYEKTATGGGTEYTAGTGIDITEGTISIDGQVVATKSDLGKAKILTTSDYNYPETGTKTGVAPWLLEPGVYVKPENFVLYKNSSLTQYEYERSITFIKAGEVGKTAIIWDLTDLHEFQTYSSGSLVAEGDFLTSLRIVDNLNSTSSTNILSAKQGKVLKEKIEGIAITGAGTPTTSTVGTIGQLYEDTTNGKLYICTDTTGGSYTWTEVGAGGGATGEAKLLTTADYNYDYGNTGTNNAVALWLLPEGYYTVPSDGSVQTAITSSTVGNYLDSYIVGLNSSGSGFKTITILDGASGLSIRRVDATTGSQGAFISYLDANNVQNSTGNSQSYVMSQNATTSMVYADPTTKNKLRIGNGASVGYFNGTAIGQNATHTSNANESIVIGHGAQLYGGAGSVAIGYNAGSNNQSAHDGCIALGAYATAPLVNGTMNIGTTQKIYGYNSSNYRLITGVYDGQGLHDCATLAQGNKLSTSAPTTSDVGVLGQLWTDTTGMHTYQLTAIDTTDPDNPSYTWTSRW